MFVQVVRSGIWQEAEAAAEARSKKQEARSRSKKHDQLKRKEMKFN